MQFTPLELAGAFVVDVDVHEDSRGLFARTFCAEEFAGHGLAAAFPQCNVSYNARRGTLRGMHLQDAPHAEAKLVRCVRGAIFDVILDLRPGSPTHAQWVAEELTAENRRALYIPEGMAHGFLSLTDGSEVFYQMSTSHSAAHARGVRWNDPSFGITWPLDRAGVSAPILSARDAEYGNYVPGRTP